MPNAVSGRVVKTRTRTPGRPTVGRSNSTPSLRPIQFRCIVSTRSGQPGRRSHQASSSSAYAVILKNQPSISRGVTSELHRQQRPSSTCSLARTVWQDGYHLTVGRFGTWVTRNGSGSSMASCIYASISTNVYRSLDIIGLEFYMVSWQEQQRGGGGAESPNPLPRRLLLHAEQIEGFIRLLHGVRVLPVLVQRLGLVQHRHGLLHLVALRVHRRRRVAPLLDERGAHVRRRRAGRERQAHNDGGHCHERLHPCVTPSHARLAPPF